MKDAMKKPQLSFRFDKHHVRDFYVLVGEKDSLTIEGKKHVGPAIVEIDQRGIKRKITKHSFKSKKLWDIIGTYTRIGIWATNTRLVAPFMPDDILAFSKRYKGMDNSQRTRLRKAANKTARSRMRRV
jgi:hypothetical protein